MEVKMTETNETNEVEFREPVTPTGGRSPAVRVGIVAGSALLVVIGAVAAMGASPAPSTATDPAVPGASAAPGTTTPNTIQPGWGGKMGGMAMRGGDFRGAGFRDITIASIAGSDLALKTDDGWSRTITVTSTTTITKGGATITAADLKVGDEIRFSQTKGTDGTYTVTAIVVVLPHVAGEVKTIDGQTLTVTQPDGTTATIHVDGDTTYLVNGVAGKLSDIAVGSFIAAEGTLRADGSLDADAVRIGFRGHDGGRGHGFPGGHDDQLAPNASPAPSSSAG
jgi:hypothetical protein